MHMRKLRTLLVMIASPFIATDLNAQGYQWSNTGGEVGISNSFLGALDIPRDPAGNLYLFNDAISGLLACGQFFANITFGSITLPTGTTGKGFIAEVAPDGTFVTGFASGTSVSPL